ncbi:hypothetical protein V1477_004072 [Vespula maculifrons]|uniref:Uncharacterized protein n=1 Tax=Vespula maculifrons TaxID=7453 RepID=A0ABD2CQJ7_VESMC
MPFRFGSFRFLSKLEMCKTPLTDRSTVHTVGFRHLETRPVVSIFRSKNQNVVLGRTLSRVREHPRACRPSRAILIYSIYVSVKYRPRSYRLEVAASEDPRANGPLYSNIRVRDAFPLREFRAYRKTGNR